MVLDEDEDDNEEMLDDEDEEMLDEEIPDSEADEFKDGDFHLPEDLDCVSGDTIFMGLVCAIDDMIA